MKKSKLLALLNSIDGDPDILFWNGFVNDWQDIDTKPVFDTLSKPTFNHIKRMVEIERALQRNDHTYKLPDDDIAALKSKYTGKYNWEINDYVSDVQVKDKHYKRKTVVFLNAKSRNTSILDRVNLSY
jgi:hypothetical protein